MIPGLSLYIHIPFCRSRCLYCDFNSYAGMEWLIPRYVSALKKEIALRQREPKARVGTIYFGGGTPSLLKPEQVALILEACRACFEVAPEAEITLEANPDSTGLDCLQALRSLGVNRLSLGFQSLDDGELRLLGRRHSTLQAVEAYRLSLQAGFDNVNIDLIYGLPGQTLEAWQETLSRTLELAADHLSLYSLTLEEDTPLGQAVAAGGLPAPDPDLAADMYLLAEERLAQSGYNHYEISNWARPGRECRHNLTYWHNLPYLGLGAGAHSFYGSRRFANEASPEQYALALEAGRLPEVASEVIDRALEVSETLILGLRLSQGLAWEELARRFGDKAIAPYRAEIDELKTLGLVEVDGLGFRLTRRGGLLGNEAFRRFLPREERAGP